MNLKALPILARGERYVVISKPSGLLVHRTPLAPSDNIAVIQILRDQLGQKVWACHRLDRATSGCLVMALDPDWVKYFVAGLRSEEAEKRYIALVRGNMIGFEQAKPVDTPIKVKPGKIKEALTYVQCIAGSKEPRCSLALATPRTGRNHQVRRHLRDLNHPVIRDAVHGDSKCNKHWSAEWGLNRLALHCLSLDIPIPGETRLQVVAPVPDDLGHVLRRMPWWDQAVASIPELALAPAEEEG
jgi:tRNA pseudouridine65 synthase